MGNQELSLGKQGLRGAVQPVGELHDDAFSDVFRLSAAVDPFLPAAL